MVFSYWSVVSSVFEENQIGDSSPCSAAHPFLQLGHRLYVFISIKKE